MTLTWLKKLFRQKPVDPNTEIADYMRHSKYFSEQIDAHGKRYYFIREGKEAAYIWFKYTLGRWNIFVYGGDSDYTTLESVKQLRELLKLDT